MRLQQWALALPLLLSSALAAETNSTSPRVILAQPFHPPQVFRNLNLVRNINLEKSYARETVNVVFENVSPEPQEEYFLPFEKGTIGRVGGVEVKDRKVPERVGYRSELVEIDPFSMTEYYRITFPSPLAPKDQLTLSITYNTLSSLTPLPAAIEQADKQFLSYSFSAYAPSAYTTNQQKTKLKFSTVEIPDYTTLPASNNAEGKEDPQRQGTSFTYGPYSERAAGAEEIVSVRYEWTKPLPHSSLLERDVEVSHWGGNLATEERIWLTNRAATLKNHFSRVAYQQAQYYNGPSPAIKEMKVPLRGGSVDAYFIDDVGNVSTSHHRAGIEGGKEGMLELRPRYPVFGGWSYSFKLGFNGQLKNYLRKVKGERDTFVLRVPFFEALKQAEGVEYERIVTRIILPEGADNVRYETTVPILSSSLGLTHSFMDTLGRTTLTLTAVNVVDEIRDREIIVTYEYPWIETLRKPGMIAGSVFGVFAVAWAIGRIPTGIGKVKKV